MKIKEIQNIYETNVIVLEKLYDLLENNTSEYDKEVVESAIKKIEDEQKDLKMKLRRKHYSNINTKDKSILMNHNTNNIDKKEEVKEEIKEEVSNNIKEEPKKEEIIYDDARIYFDGYKYKLIYNNDKCIKVFSITHSNNPSYCYDENILFMLRDFDEKNHTGLYYSYVYDNLPVTYVFDNTDKDKRIKNIKRVARNGKNKHDNINVIYTRKNKFKKLAIITTVAALALTTIGISSRKTNRKPDVVPVDKIIENTIEENTTEEITESKSDVLDENMVIDVRMDDVDNQNEDVEPSIESNLSDNKVEEPEVNIGDTINLGNVNLYYASTDNVPVGNTSYLNSNTYKVGLISVVYQNKVVKYIDEPVASIDFIKNECAIKYGEDAKVFVNLDLLDESGENTITKYVGWIDSDDLYSLNKVKIR